MIRQVIIGSIKAYQRLKGLFCLSCCRFHPSCSHYAVDAFNRHGVLKGTAKTLWRIMRCSPLSRGGYDPVR